MIAAIAAADAPGLAGMVDADGRGRRPRPTPARPTGQVMHDAASAAPGATSRESAEIRALLAAILLRGEAALPGPARPVDRAATLGALAASTRRALIAQARLGPAAVRLLAGL
ncbi:hypothetical protein [Sphingomonas morindae]|uniref:Uncharacterized protein n=1 Tax=Sphingomonas morindae TaxID=1541170 RepID=A0ABY4XA22_9SPHN|nr:hypothetical protein [Sphingomonas morindae]USI73710.1 hypothetical protein LHA26_04360 [Sphingomonas morindae]